MTESIPTALRGRRRSPARFLLRTGRRTLVESLYLLSAPVTAAAGLLLAAAGVGLGAVAWVLPGRSRLVAGALAPARWSADLERWRIATVRSLGAGTAGQLPRAGRIEALSDPELWLDVAHAVVLLPVTLVTALITGLWWFIGVAGVTVLLRIPITSSGTTPPSELSTGSNPHAAFYISVSLGLRSPLDHIAFALVVGGGLLVTLPLATRACTAVQAGMGQALLSDASALYRRIRGLEQERDTARAQTVAAVTAEATALRRLERDIHDGPQQRLVRLALELGRAQHNFDRRPEVVREALADALVQTQEALDELRALSRGIAPPILVDRGLREALTGLAARSVVPVDLDIGALSQRLDTATETAAYFVVAEALTNVAKHSHARRCAVGLHNGAGTLWVRVTDDGMGGAALAKGHGLTGLDDRLRAVGGRLRVTSPAGGPTTITAELPCR